MHLHLLGFCCEIWCASCYSRKLYHFSFCLSNSLAWSFWLYVIFSAKSGINPSGCAKLVEHVKLQCPNLIFSGLMTIGMPDYTSNPQNFRVILYSYVDRDYTTLEHCIKMNSLSLSFLPEILEYLEMYHLSQCWLFSWLDWLCFLSQSSCSHYIAVT